MSPYPPNNLLQWKSLDGARALSILCVLACHLLPLGPKTHVDLNIAVGQFGMAIFFCLSGFLIAHKLITEPSLTEFAINRAMRIMPLLWLLLIIGLSLRLPDISNSSLLAHFLVMVNNFPSLNFKETEHLWSVCVEIHFYILAGLSFYLFRRSGLFMLVVVGFLLTAYRYHEQALFNPLTIFRMDELLIGLGLGLLWHSNAPWAQYLKKNLALINPLYMMLGLFVASLAPPSPVLFVLRPYIAALFIGSLLFNSQAHLTRVFAHSAWNWTSRHSYALYIIHPFLLMTWLSSGDKLEMYMKRPLLFAALFVLAYVSTRYYEQFFIQLGKKWIKARRTAKLDKTAATLPNPIEPAFYEHRTKNTV
ncbi:MAG TPA: acyltransferase [Limnobacter sp.]|nr:acyltransferase [Limnobacter sp.]